MFVAESVFDPVLLEKPNHCFTSVWQAHEVSPIPQTDDIVLIENPPNPSHSNKRFPSVQSIGDPLFKNFVFVWFTKFVFHCCIHLNIGFRVGNRIWDSNRIRSFSIEIALFLSRKFQFPVCAEWEIDIEFEVNLFRWSWSEFLSNMATVFVNGFSASSQIMNGLCFYRVT
jgi:hypothetical protein